MASAVAAQERAAVTKCSFWLGSSSFKAHAKQSVAKSLRLLVVTMTASVQHKAGAVGLSATGASGRAAADDGSNVRYRHKSEVSKDILKIKFGQWPVQLRCPWNLGQRDLV